MVNAVGRTGLAAVVGLPAIGTVGEFALAAQTFDCVSLNDVQRLAVGSRTHTA